MSKNLYLFIVNFFKRCKKIKAHAMKKRTHLRALIQRVLTMKPNSVSTINQITVLWFCVQRVTSRFKLAIVLNTFIKK